MFKYFINHIKKYRLLIFLFLITSIIFDIIEIIIPYILSNFIDNITIYKNTKLILNSSLILFMLIIFQCLFNYLKEILYTKSAQQIRYAMLDNSISHIEKSQIKDINTFNPAYLNQRLNDDILNIINFMLTNVCNSIIKIITLVSLSIIVININFKIFIVIVLSVTVNSFGFFFYNKLLYKTGYDYREANNNFYAAHNDRLSMIKQTKINSWFEVVKLKCIDFFNILLSKSANYAKTSAKLNNIGYLSTGLSLILIIILGGNELLMGNLTIGQLILTYNYANICINCSKSFLSITQSYQHAAVCYNRMSEILNLKLEINGSKRLNSIDSIEIKNLSFQYNSSKKLYENLNYKFTKGHIYCVKGDNGSGKSTLLDIILGLRYDYDGQILYNGLDLKNLDSNFLRKNLISVVEQEPKLINVSLKENLVYGLENYSDSTLFDFCNYFDLNDVLNSTESKLSGGEKQKIAIIRSFLKLPQLIVLDEPISALDSESIKKLKNTLTYEKNNKIIILITHNEELDSIIDEVIELEN